MVLRDDSYTLFYEKSVDELDSIEAGLLELEQTQGSSADTIVHSLFRQVHNIKGSASFYELNNVVAIAHRMETLLGMLRTKHITIESELIAILLSGKDWIARLLEEDGYEQEVSLVVSQFEEFIDQKVEGNRAQNNGDTGIVDVGIVPDETIWRVSSATLMEAQKSSKGGKFIYLFVFDLIEDIEKKGKTPQEVIGEFDALTKLVESKLDIQNFGGLDDTNSDIQIPLYLLCATIMDPIIVKEILGVSESNVKIIEEEYLILPDGLPDEVPDLLSEKAKKLKEKALNTQIPITVPYGELLKYEKDLALSSSWEQDKHIVQELLASPTVKTFSKYFSDLLQSMENRVGKRFDFDISFQSSSEVLLYFLISFQKELENIITNAVLHGLELPRERIALGKSMAGRVTIEAKECNNNLVVTVVDDGCGINRVALRKYKEMYQAKQVDLDLLTEEELIDLILHSEHFSLATFHKELTPFGGHLEYEFGSGKTVVTITISLK